nr:unnamed protein product [Spirometra erinaceieuropaei]
MDSVPTCPHCDHTFTIHIGLVGQLRIHRTEAGEPVLGAPACTRRIRLLSPHCPRTFIRRMGLSGHMRIHDSAIQYSINTPSRSFTPIIINTSSSSAPTTGSSAAAAAVATTTTTPRPPLTLLTYPAHTVPVHLPHALACNCAVLWALSISIDVLSLIAGTTLGFLFLTAVEAFNRARKALADTTALVHPIPDAPLSIVADASNFATGAALQQQTPIGTQSLAFYSTKLASPQTRYSTLALKRAPSELSSYQEKIIPIDSHVGMAITGLTADGFLLGRSMRRECADNKWAYDEPLPVSRLLSKISLKMQVPTQRYGRRPFGVGMLVTGFDAQGPHVYYLCPSSNAYDCKAFAVGSRSQSARTYLERHLDQFPDSSLEELIQHGLAALKGCLPNESELTGKNCALAVVGKGLDFTVYDEEMVQPYLDSLAAKAIAVESAEPPPVVPEPMEEDKPVA